MTKKRNGFTLVELLATIVILGILVLIAIPAYNVISNNVKKRQNENKISYIETQAAKYVAESGLYSDIDETSITVQTLLQNGYLDGDNKIGDKVEDVYGKDITCYQIKISFEKGKPVPEFIDKNVLNQDGVCIVNDLFSGNILELDAYKINQLNDNNKIEIRNHRTVWVDNDVVLKLKINDAELNSKRDQAIISIDWNAVNNSKSYSQSNDNWYTTGWLDNIASYNGSTDYKNVYTVSTSKIMADTKFKISLVVNYLDDNGKKINETLTTYLIVRIDKENPTVTATADTNWTKGNKKIFITGNDKQGSGINHFCMFTSNTSNHTCNQGDASYVPLVNANSNKGEVTKAKGTYYVWAVDNVGNYSLESARVVVDNIDTTKPTCVYENQNTTWKKGSQVITVKCSDDANGSGCITKPYNVTFADNTYNSANLPSSYIITDYAGNKTTCSGPVNVYVDNNAPTINTLTHSKGVTTIKVSDTGELSKYEIINSSNSVIKTVTLSGTSSETTYSSVAAGTYTLKVYDKAGNTTSKNFTIPSYKVTFALKTAGTGSFSSTSQNVNYGANATSTLTINGGYNYGSVSGTGCTVSGSTVTASNVTAAVTCTVTLNPIKYTVTYQTNNSACSNGSSGNPTEYYVTTDTFTLKNPTCTGYTFNGWTGANGTTVSTSVSVAKGSTGNKTFKANWTINKYYLDLNGYLDGANSGNISGFGTADIYVNGTRVADDGTDYYIQWDYGTSYEIKDIKAATGHTYNGVNAGSLKGTVGSGGANTGVRLDFSTNSYTVTFKSNNTGMGTVATGSVTTKYGTTASTTFSAKSGYTYASVSGSGCSVSGSTVKVDSVSGNVTCTVNFKSVCSYAVGKEWTFNASGGTCSNKTWTPLCNGVYEITLTGGTGGQSYYHASDTGYWYSNHNCVVDSTGGVMRGGGKVIATYRLYTTDTITYNLGGLGVDSCSGYNCGEHDLNGAAGCNGGVAGSKGGQAGSGGQSAVSINGSTILTARGGDGYATGWQCYVYDTSATRRGGGSNQIITTGGRAARQSVMYNNSNEETTYVTFKLVSIQDATCPAVNTSWDFGYTGNFQKANQVWSAPCTGKYRLEVWGAQGGNINSEYKGSKGGYAKGEIVLNAGEVVYSTIGGQGVNCTDDGCNGGFNGGGYGRTGGGVNASSGGGASHMSHYGGLLTNGTVRHNHNLLVVAGGGGGTSSYTQFRNVALGGTGGGTNGGAHSGGAAGGTQSAGGASQTGANGSAGQGGNASGVTDGAMVSGGGGGWYGGGAGRFNVAGGGSGHINTNHPTGFSSYTMSNGSREGNGYGRITYIGQ